MGKFNKLYANMDMGMFIKKGKFVKVFWHFIHAVSYYPKLNHGHHTKPSDLNVMLKYQTWISL